VFEISHSRIHGNGLFAKCHFITGSVVAHSRGYLLNANDIPLASDQSRISFQIGPALHFVPDVLAEIPINGLANVNHSCDPNTYVRFDHRSSQLILIALKSIDPGDELTCDYDATEAIITINYKSFEHAKLIKYHQHARMHWGAVEDIVRNDYPFERCMLRETFLDAYADTIKDCIAIHHCWLNDNLDTLFTYRKFHKYLVRKFPHELAAVNLKLRNNTSSR
jgi:hypothetical protein